MKTEDRRYIYKILTENEWEQLNQNQKFLGSPLDLKDGYIHASFEEQKLIILEKYFSEITPVYLLKIDPLKLGSDCLVKHEKSVTSQETYPHIYGTLCLDAVESYEIIN